MNNKPPDGCSHIPGSPCIKQGDPLLVLLLCLIEIFQRTPSQTLPKGPGDARFSESECKGTDNIRNSKIFQDIFSEKIDFLKITTKRKG